MLSVTKVLGKVLVARFYERNAGLFFVVFYLMFGIVESSQIISYHQSLIYATLTSLVFQLMVGGVWLLYSVKCIQFIAEQLRQPQNQFVFQGGPCLQTVSNVKAQKYRHGKSHAYQKWIRQLHAHRPRQTFDTGEHLPKMHGISRNILRELGVAVKEE